MNNTYVRKGTRPRSHDKYVNLGICVVAIYITLSFIKDEKEKGFWDQPALKNENKIPQETAKAVPTIERAIETGKIDNNKQ